MNYLPKATILACRGVSKQAKTAVDDEIQAYHASPDGAFKGYFQPSACRLHQATPNGIYSQMKAIGERYQFHSSPRIQNFLANVGQPTEDGENPILTRAISLRLGAYFAAGLDANGFEQFEQMQRLHFENNLELLRTVGSHVWRLDIKIDNFLGAFLGSTIGGSVNFKNLLRHAANVKILKISEIGALFSRLEMELDSIPYRHVPKLSHLVSLDITGAPSVPFYRGLVLKHRNQLTHFACNGSFFEVANPSVKLLNRLLPNVRKLSVKKIGVIGLDLLSKVEWKLEELHFNGYSDGNRRVSVSDFVKAVANFAETLVELRILAFPLGRGRVNLSQFIKTKMLSGFPNLGKLVVFHYYLNKSWFKELLYSKCGQLTELHVLLMGASQVDTWMIGQTFKKLPKLNKIVFWREDLRSVMGEPFLERVINRADLIRKK